VIAPTQGSVDEQDAQSFSNGVFYGVVDGVPRPFREAGVASFDLLPAGAPCCVPRFDQNPERLRIDSNGQPLPSGLSGPTLEVNAGALVSGVTGPLELSFRTWSISPDLSPPPVVSNLGSAVAVPEPSPDEFTVGSFNLQRFFDTVDDPIGDPVLTALAFEARLNKASLAIRNVMRTPDILGVEEAENLTTLQTLAARVNGDAVAAGQPDPLYEAHLFEGNDIGGIDSGFLVKRARVSDVHVTQVGKTATFTNPNTGGSETLNDRPPLLLQAKVQGPVGLPLPVTVIVNHLRSLNGVDSVEPNGSGTEGARVRAKRAAQAEYLAGLIQARQAADPAERIVSVGDYNAFAVNDGYGDSIGTIEGQPTPADEVVRASPDLVDPNLTNLVDGVSPEQGYSYSFDGNIQTLDHILVNQAGMKRFSRFHVARNNADFPESYRNDPDRPERISDHDMPVAYFSLAGPVLNLLGANPLTVECCTSFTDPGATASDADLGDLTAQIQVSGSVDPHSVGSYVLTYSVSNGFQTTTQTRTVNVVDTAPPALVLNGSSPMTIELGGVYLEPGATASDACAGDLTGAIQVGGVVNTSSVGSYAVVYSVSDGYNTTQVTRVVDVRDTTAPEIEVVRASPHVLWPPNGRLVPVVIGVRASDASGTPSCRITDVDSDERVRGHGSGHRAPDWVVLGPHVVLLRAERDARGDGRTYTITVTCRDTSGNVETGTTTVIVPHDKGRGRGHGHHDDDGCERQPRRRRR
jgi:hypothetical protein